MSSEELRLAIIVFTLQRSGILSIGLDELCRLRGCPFPLERVAEPLCRLLAGRAFEGQVHEEPTPGELRLERQRVVWVDDNEPVRQIMERLLGERFWITALGCPLAAYDHVREEKVDILATEHLLPERSGYELAMRVRKIRPRLPILVTTALFSEELAEDYRKLGMTELLQKPFTPDRVPALLGNLIFAAREAEIRTLMGDPPPDNLGSG